jgi:hypothetical protein
MIGGLRLRASGDISINFVELVGFFPGEISFNAEFTLFDSRIAIWTYLIDLFAESWWKQTPAFTTE